MFQKIYLICAQSAKGKNLVALLFAYLFMNVLVLQWLVSTLMEDSNLFKLIDWQFNYTVEQVYALLKSYGSQGRERYILIELTINTIIPFTYALLLGFTLILVYKKLAAKEQVIKSLFLIPFVALLADMLENACIILLLVNYPYKLMWVAKAVNVFTYSKWVLIFACIALVITGIVLAGFRYIKFKFVAKSVTQ